MEEESFIQERKSGNNKLIIIILVLLVLLGGGFAVYKFAFDKKEDSGEKEKKEEEVRDYNKENLELFPYLKVVTAQYDTTDENKEFIGKVFGDNSEEKFRVYFQWFNVIHELAHGLVTYNSNTEYLSRTVTYTKEGYIEEQKVNDFAAAYWKRYGDPEKLQLVKDTIDYILSTMQDPTNGTKTIEEYAKDLWTTGDPNSTFEAYGWFQFNIVKNSLEKDLTVEEALKNLGIDMEVTLDDEKLTYGTVNETTCEKIIEDTVNKFQKWGLNYPKIYHVYSNDPNDNSSMPITEDQYETSISV